ncbi:MAG: hypothetical protein ACXVBE_05835 [Bdellovibrionota bacterium]
MKNFTFGFFMLAFSFGFGSFASAAGPIDTIGLGATGCATGAVIGGVAGAAVGAIHRSSTAADGAYLGGVAGCVVLGAGAGVVAAMAAEAPDHADLNSADTNESDSAADRNQE